LTQQSTADFHPEIFKLFDSYVHGLISRQNFLNGIGEFCTDGQSAEDVLDALSPRFNQNPSNRTDDPSITTTTVEFPSPDGYGFVRGYMARPVEPSARLATILVVHENRGLNPHIEDIVRRLAFSGFIAFAPDALHPLGGYPGDEDKARELFGQLDQTKTRNDFLAAVKALKHLPEGNANVGVVGFCYGGGIASFLATKVEDLGAAVSFYGNPPKVEDVVNIKSQVQIHLAEHDERINSGWPGYEAALKASGVRYEAYIYPGTQHGFNNDTTPRYDATAAALAWQRTLAFFETHLTT
jgi:carboxymethylenebutenolidase